MSIATGTRFGPYEIVALLGSGGMGEVYRARDTRLGREVAIKVLPDALARDAEHLARFQREAQLLAALNHPYIASIYGLEESGGIRCLVLELVEGPTLAERLRQGPMETEESLHLARQLAEALEAAHERGIIHRDLKPANIKLTPEDKVKVLDFGLAKETSRGSQDPVSDLSASPTRGALHTQAGIILGTAPYMSPEQAAGKPVDKRSDIWSFGVVLWEMITGRRLFQGETVTHTLAAVLRDEIDPGDLPSSTPPAVRALLRRCLERNVRNRLRDIGEARVILTEVAEGKQDSGRPASAPVSKAAWIVAALAGTLAFSLGVALWHAARPANQPFIQLKADLGEELTSGTRFTPAVSPDGSQIVCTVKRDGKDLLAIRPLSESKATVLPGTEGANLPFFSPDGRWIGFFAEDKLKKVSARGGPVMLVCNAPNGRGASWGEDDTIVAAIGFAGGLYRIPASGGEPQVLTKPADYDQISHRWPQILPHGQAVIFTGHTATADFDHATIEAVSLKTGRRKTVLRGGYFARFLPSGHLVYMHEGRLFAIAFDPDSLELKGSPFPIIEDVLSSPGSGSAHIAFSSGGTFVYYMNSSEPLLPHSMAWIDASGSAQPLPAPPDFYQTLRLSPDGSRLAVSVKPSAGDIWIHDAERGNPIRLTDTARNNHWPVWMPDGKHIIYTSLTGKGYAFWWKNSDGSGEPRELRTSHNEMHSHSISPDGNWLAFEERGPDTRMDLWLLPLDLSNAEHPKAGTPLSLLQTPRSEGSPVFSPDGRWIAFVGTEGSANEIYVRPGLAANGRPSSAAGRWRISNGGGDFPVWSKTEKKLFFASSDRHVMVAEYRVEGESFEANSPRRWSAKPLNTDPALNFDLARDGRRVLGFPAGEQPSRAKEAVRMTILMNFFGEVEHRLKSAAPSGR